MNRPPSRRRLNRPPAAAPMLAGMLALAPALAAPLAAQQTFNLPPPSPTPTPAPAGPSDERGGVAIPPRAVPTASPTPAATATPTIQPLPSPGASVQAPGATPAPRGNRVPAASPTGAAPVPAPAALPGASTDTASGTIPAPTPTAAAGPGFSLDPTAPSLTPTRPEGAPITASLPDWWPFAASGIGALALLGGGVLAWRRRKPKVLRLAAPAEGTSAPPPEPDEAPRLDLTLAITAASRSLMMFTIEYRLSIANRSARAVGGLSTAVQLACARASAATGGRAAPSAGAAQALADVDRIGPHQAHTLSGTVQLPLSAIAPLRQGQTPLFVPLVHVTLEGENLPAQARTFVIGTPSSSGRVHPILLDAPPGGITGLVAQAVAVPSASAAA